MSDPVWRLYEALSRTNRAIARAEHEQPLLEEICQIAVGHGGFVLATVGLLADGGRLRVRAAAGLAIGYLDGFELSLDEHDAVGQGAGGRALRAGSHEICNDFLGDPRNAPWAERARAHGIASSAAMPLRCNGVVTGLFSVYGSATGQFGPHEIALLDDMALDISIGLDTLARADLARRSLRQLRHVEEAVGIGVFTVRLPQWSVWWSPGLVRTLGLPAQSDWAAIEAAASAGHPEVLRGLFEDAATSGEPIDVDLPLAGGTASERWIRLRGAARDAAGDVEISAVVEDVSALKRLELSAVQATSDDRRQIAAELHDNLGQLLTGASLLLDSLRRDLAGATPDTLARFDLARSSVGDALRACGSLARNVAPIMEGGLVAALEGLALRTAATGVACDLRVSGDVDRALSQTQATEIYRISQEAVANALKHARCAHIELRISARRAGVELVVRDDGVGFGAAAARAAEGLGLRTMRYRAARAGGSLRISPAPGGGTRARVAVPRLPRATP